MVITYLAEGDLNAAENTYNGGFEYVLNFDDFEKLNDAVFVIIFPWKCFSF